MVIHQKCWLLIRIVTKILIYSASYPHKLTEKLKKYEEINNSKVNTFVFYEWEGYTRLTMWATPASPIVLKDKLFAYAYRNGNTLFFCQINEDVSEKAKKEIIEGIVLRSVKELNILQKNGEPFSIDYIYEKEKWNKIEQGIDVGKWILATEKTNKSM